MLITNCHPVIDPEVEIQVLAREVTGWDNIN
jgi:hypothetical protein